MASALPGYTNSEGDALHGTANGIDDDDDIALGNANDCNFNALPDSCDIADGISEDANSNGRPDECERFFWPSRPPGAAVTTTLPLCVLPPMPKVGGRLRLALGMPAWPGSLAFVTVRSDSSRLGIVFTAVGEDGVVRLELPIPDHASLAGRRLQMRAGIRENSGVVRWSDERVINLAR